MNTATTINQARLEANRTHRAANLFGSLGYSFRHWSNQPGTFTVYALQNSGKTGAYIVDTISGTCQCEGRKLHGTCAHLQACEEEYRLIVLVDSMEAAYNDSDAFIPAAPVALVGTCNVCGTPALWDDAPDATCARCETRAY